MIKRSKPFVFLDRMRENVLVLDEQIANALQWTKTLRDLIELRNVQLDKIKAHLLGRDETGAVIEPENYWDENQQVEFERYFKNQLSPWSLEDLKLECEGCHVKSEDVSNRYFSHPYPTLDENLDLCKKCYDKRTSKSPEEGNENSTEKDS